MMLGPHCFSGAALARIKLPAGGTRDG